MPSPKEIYWAISRRRDPKLVAATVEAKALGVTIEGSWESAINSVALDAVEALGCAKIENLDLSRERHLDVLSDVMRQLIQDHIDSHGGSTDSSQSSLLKKAP